VPASRVSLWVDALRIGANLGSQMEANVILAVRFGHWN
jgi:hypothetical protein